ncbi:MAG TPA: hypothetical protein VGI85_01340 [Chthoniobacterales bacterium]|jgi:hypothetical protein
MDPPPDVEFHKSPRLLVWRPHGPLNESAVNGIIKFMGDEEATSNKPFHRFTDTSEIDAVDLNFRYIFHVSLFRRLSYSGRPPVKSAILATDATAVHYARMHALLTEGSSLKVKIFGAREDVAKWLKIPVEFIAGQ